MTRSNICVVLPGPPAYSETFLTAHVDKLHATVRYLKHFPVGTDGPYLSEAASGGTEMLKQRFKACVHGYVLNPAKRMYLRNFFRANKVRVVLAEFGLTGVGALEVCRGLRIPLVVHFHGWDAYVTENLIRHKETYKKMFMYSKAIIAVSKHMTDQLVQIGAPKEKVFCNPYGVDVSKFERSSPLASRVQVLAVGRFVEKKAPYLTILSFQKVVQRLPQARLVMVGAGPLHEVCCQLVKSLHMERSVELRGVMDHDQVALLMQQSRVFVQHSLVPKSGDSEGTPVAILEASASALPIVSTRHTGIIDAVIHGKTGYLVDEGDIEGMAEYIYQLLANGDLATEMGCRGREHVVQNYDIENSIKKLRDILEQHSL